MTTARLANAWRAEILIIEDSRARDSKRANVVKSSATAQKKRAERRAFNQLLIGLPIEGYEPTSELSVFNHRTDFRGFIHRQCKTENKSGNRHRNDEKKRDAELTAGGIPVKAARKTLFHLIVEFINERHIRFPPRYPARAGVAASVLFPDDGLKHGDNERAGKRLHRKSDFLKNF
jgi:hypothetical protein